MGIESMSNQDEDHAYRKTYKSSGLWMGGVHGDVVRQTGSY